MNRTAATIYCDVFDGLERDGARYVVVGGVAVVLRGYARPVSDLDIVVPPAPGEAGRALRALMLAGFVPTVPLPFGALTVMRMLDRSGRGVDVFARFRIPFEELWAGSERMPVGGSAARAMSLAHLLSEKRAAGRAGDLLDIEGLCGYGGRGGEYSLLAPTDGGRDDPT